MILDINFGNKGKQVANIKSGWVEEYCIQWEGPNYFHLGRKSWDSSCNSGGDTRAKMVLKIDCEIIR